ncbi:MAG: insulinase family protein [Ruminococcaceae bacterium]|nr:insulinase family protein [Oscillospiraceae bacterium]
MNRFTEFHSERLNESFFYHKHSTGVHIYVFPNPRSKEVHASFAARYGSIDDRFCFEDGEVITTPAGVAHFLEHKLFENEDCGAFERYAKTGASANAYTSYDSTRYIFTTAANFEQAFEILLDFVQSPYFTEETVQKEQGIIGQELRMYEDDPEWQVLLNLLKAMYSSHPIRTDIGGSVSSIAQITADTLYTCYNAFYHPENMVLAVAGNVQPETVLDLADRLLKPSTAKPAQTVPFNEPDEVATALVERRMDTGTTLFQLGFKDTAEQIDAKDYVLTSILLRAIAGSTTPLFERMLNEGIINNTFSIEYYSIRGAQCSIFGGESAQPERVRDEIIAEIERIRTEGLDDEQFECARRAKYASLIRSTSDNDDIASLMSGMFIDGINPYDMIDAAAMATKADAEALLSRRLDASRHTLSIVRPNA